MNTQSHKLCEIMELEVYLNECRRYHNMYWHSTKSPFLHWHCVHKFVVYTHLFASMNSLYLFQTHPILRHDKDSSDPISDICLFFLSFFVNKNLKSVIIILLYEPFAYFCRFSRNFAILNTKPIICWKWLFCLKIYCFHVNFTKKSSPWPILVIFHGTIIKISMTILLKNQLFPCIYITKKDLHDVFSQFLTARSLWFQTFGLC